MGSTPPIVEEEIETMEAEPTVDADVILIVGDLTDDCAEGIELVCNTHRSKRAIIIPATFGGSASVAYRLARCLQRHYEHITALIVGPCYSAGTLLAIGAHEISMGNHGVLGPLDVQLMPRDELMRRTSGLTLNSAFDALKRQAFNMFEEDLLELTFRSQGQVSLRTAMEVATNLTTGLLSPIYSQIDPNKLGEDERAMTIAYDFGIRLCKCSDNIKHNGLERLVAGYPTHDFPIDITEANEIFERVREPEGIEIELAKHLGQKLLDPAGPLRVQYLMGDEDNPTIERENENEEGSTEVHTAQPVEKNGSGHHDGELAAKS